MSKLTNDERRCLQMWFRQAMVRVEGQEALSRITAFYNGETKARESHFTPVTRRPARPTLGARAKELV